LLLALTEALPIIRHCGKRLCNLTAPTKTKRQDNSYSLYGLSLSF
jgi:hypothetical protein